MERKRKLPARAAARVEHIAKKRTATPPERSVTPVSATTPTSQPPPDAPAQLPRSVQSGVPLPTVEDAQAEDLSLREYQNIQESGVLSESLQRSRQRWIAEGVFEKYWTKPTKRKGVVNEEPNNPPKESMSRLGHVTITIEPHIFEATMYAVKDPKSPPPIPAPTTQATFRPIMQFGPPNGAMPPPPTPKVEAATPAPATPVLADAHPAPPPQSPVQAPSVVTQSQSRPQSSAANESPRATPAAAVQGNGPVLAPAPVHATSASPGPAASPSVAPGQPPGGASTPRRHVSASPAPAPAPATPGQATGAPGPGSRPPSAANTPSTAAVKPATGAAAPKANGPDPIIMTLAEKASEDPQLRDLMKRVANGEARQDELTKFQRIIDQITVEYKRKGGQQGPSADRLIVDGKTVKYFAEEVRAILDIVLTTNPQQKSSTLIPPAGSDALVVALVKAALDDINTRGMIRRIAEHKPGFNDATDLKAILDKLHKSVQAAPPPPSTPKPSPKPLAATAPANGLANGQLANQVASPKVPHNQPQQALRSKGPPPAAKPDISAIVLEFAGGNGDRYLFPKFSIIEYLQGGHQVYASFLIVRKGSHLEYGGDAKLDYYQPVTVRLFCSGRHLDNLHRVVAPQDEVRRYMDDVMDNMTRAEYVVLAMRLPRGDPIGQDQDKDGREVARANGSAPATDGPLPPLPAESAGPTKPPVLWGPNAKAFAKAFQNNKANYDDFVRSRRGTGDGVDLRLLSGLDGAYRRACSLLGLDETDFADYDKIIASLVAKDDESS